MDKTEREQPAPMRWLKVEGEMAREQQVRFQNHVLETVGQAIITISADHRVTYWNRAAEELFGISREAVIGLDITPYSPLIAMEHVFDTLREEGRWEGELWIDRLDGTRFLANLTKVAVFDEDGELDGAITAIQDVTAFRRTEAQLQERVKELRTLFACSELLHRDDLPLDSRLSSLLDIMPHGWRESEATEVRIQLGKLVLQTPSFRQTAWMQRAVIEGRGRPLGWIEIALTEERPTSCGGRFLDEERELLERIAQLIGNAATRAEMERQLLQSQKMEAVGRLAGGIAHDFNNLLTVIRGQTDLVLMEIDPEMQEVRTELEVIQSAADRAALVTSQLLAFSRVQVLRPQSVDVMAVVSDMRMLLSRVLRENISVELCGPPTPLYIEVDPVQLEQVIINLAVNARDAMPNGGRLLIDVAPDDESTVVIQVTDDGVGMDETVQAKIFEPFYTTKPPGQGTGLGLSMVYGFVTQSEGTVAVSSTPGQGTTFTLRFPRSDCSPTPFASPARVPASAAPKRRGRILVVEDNAPLSRVVTRVLERRSFDVVACSDVDAAIASLTADPSACQLILTDLLLPGRSGHELIEWAERHRPDLPVVVMSGYSGEECARRRLPADVPFLQKPFRPQALVDVVQETLASAPPVTPPCGSHLDGG